MAKGSSSRSSTLRSDKEIRLCAKGTLWTGILARGEWWRRTCGVRAGSGEAPRAASSVALPDACHVHTRRAVSDQTRAKGHFAVARQAVVLECGDIWLLAAWPVCGLSKDTVYM